MKNYFKRAKIVLKKGDIIDILDYFKFFLFIFLAIVTSILYYLSLLESIRSIISDTISYSSVTIGILSLLIGVLSTLKENSIFFKHLEKYSTVEGDKKSNEVYNDLLKRMGSSFIRNMLLIVLTILFGLTKPSSYILCKAFVVGIWSFLFISVTWDIFYLINIIIKISTLKEQSKRKTIS